jgi:ATP-dependent protease ClpP protease subunit
LRDPPANRYWGERKPPKNRAEMFSATVAATTSGDAGSISTGKVATLRIYGPIDSWGGWWGISARDVSTALDALGEGVDEIRVRINSPGGEAWEGLAILNMLRAHSARIVAVVDGLAASAASFVAAGCDETVMSPGTQMMIHDASTIEWGDAAAMRKTAMFLDSISDSLASLYAEAAGGTDAAWRALMVEETWYTAKEAVAAGLADRVAVVPDAGATATAGDEDEPVDPLEGDGIEDRYDLSIFNYAGREHAPAPKTPVASASGQPSKEGDADMAFLDDVRQRLGVTDAATDETAVLAALDEALKPTEPAVPVDSVVVSKAKWDEMKSTYDTMRSQLTDLLDEKSRERHQSTVKAAIAAGKIMPAEKQAYLNALEMDEEGTVKRLESLEAGIVPVAAIGHAEDRDVSLAGTRGWADNLFSDFHSDQEA